MSVWDEQRIPSIRTRWALGVYLPRRKLASLAWVPSRREQKQLRGGRPFWHVPYPPNSTQPGNFVIPANQTQEARTTFTSDFLLLAVLVSSTVGGSQTNPGARIQLFHQPLKKGKGRRFSAIGLNDINAGGSAKDPFIYRRPYRIRAGSAVLVRVQNLQNASNQVQVVLYGVQDVD